LSLFVGKTSMKSERKRQNILRISGFIDFKRLEHESRKHLFIGFFIAIILHIFLAVFVTFKISKIEFPKLRTIKVRLIEPRMPTPLTIRKRSFHKKHIQRKKFGYHKRMITMERQEYPVNIPLPEMPPFEIEYISKGDSLYSDSIEINLGISTVPDDVQVPLRNHLLDDPGMYKAEIIYNPDNKWAVQGYVHIPVIQIEDYKPIDSMRLAIRGLANAINSLTNITAVVDNPLPQLQFTKLNPYMPLRENDVRGLTVDSLFEKQPPIVYLLSDKPIKLTKAENASFGNYTRGGGILIIESCRPGNEMLRFQLKCFLRDAVGGYSRKVNAYSERVVPAFEKIPRGHPIYNCFFNFSNPSPEGAGQKYGAITHKVMPYLEGLWFGKRLVAIFSDRGYGLMWGTDSKNMKQQRMGVNLVVYTLLQRMEIHKGEWYKYRYIAQ